ncbi:MAG TPA: L,D-transpeptidase family protein [Longimicrobiales bacterium]|nr:L,D-transpeptidase family protein [Longimicrobiales bacterium]
MTNRCVQALLMIAAIVSAGCSGAEAETQGEHSPSQRLRAVLAQADSTAVLPLIAGDTVTVSAPVLEFYRRLRYRPAWTGDEDMDRARAVHAAIGRAEEDGLDPNSYGHDIAARLISLLDTEGDAALDDAARADYAADLDVVLSEGYMRYATDVVRGAIDPDSVGAAWQIPRSAAPGEPVLRSLVRGGDPVQIIERLRPRMPYYGRMMQALARLRRVRDAGGWAKLPDDIEVEEGDSSRAVMLLRARLAASDDRREAQLAGRGAANPAVYDRDLRDALRHFQERHAIDDDGTVGSGTLRELNHDVEERIAEVKLNMDRWRWLPQDLGRLFVLVNIAGFELEVVENDHAIESMNVVVGKPGWNTPVFADTMEHIVVNPYWTPPKSILEEEIYPAMERDPGYLARNNFERTANGVRQRPGPTNALGRFKFLFPNDDNIYLHDTPADHLFSRVRRDFSHGCIRLERPADLARLLVSKASSHSPASIDGMVATGAEKWIPLRKPVPVYLLYFTAWVKEDGTLRFHHDVYGHDEDLESQAVELDEQAADSSGSDDGVE